MLKQTVDQVTETTWDVISNRPRVKRVWERTRPARLRGAHRRRGQITATESITYVSSNVLLAIFSLKLLWLLPNFLGMLWILVNLVFFNVLLWGSPVPCYFVNSFWQSNTLCIFVTPEMHCTGRCQSMSSPKAWNMKSEGGLKNLYITTRSAKYPKGPSGLLKFLKFNQGGRVMALQS